MNRLLKKVLLSLMITFLIALSDGTIPKVEAEGINVATGVNVMIYEILHQDVTADLENFPVTVVVDNTDLTFGNLDKENFVFIQSNNPNQPDSTIDYSKSLLYEVDYFLNTDSFESGDKAVFHVNLPSVSSSVDTYFYMYYGSNVVSQETRFDKDMTGLPITYGTGASLTTITSIDKALTVDSGITGFVSISDPSNQLHLTGDFTIEISVLANSSLTNSSASPRLIANSSGSYTDNSFGLEYDRANSNKFKMYYKIPNVAIKSIESNSGIADNQYHQVVIQRSSGIVTMYIDGIVQAQTLTSFTESVDLSSTDNVMTIGGTRGGDAVQQYAGNIKYVRISDNARYNGTFTPTSTVHRDDNTLFATNFDTVWDDNYEYVSHMGNNLTDMTGNGYVTSNTSSLPTPNLIDAILGESTYFNGSGTYFNLGSLSQYYASSITETALLKMHDSARLNVQQLWGARSDNSVAAWVMSNPGWLQFGRNSEFEYRYNGVDLSWPDESVTSFDFGNFQTTSNIYSSGTHYAFIDSSKSNVGSGLTNLSSVDADYVIGKSAYGDYSIPANMYLDEFRVSNIARSDAWILLEQMSINDLLLHVTDVGSLISVTELNSSYIQGESNITLISDVAIDSSITSFDATVVIENPELGDVLSSSNDACANISALNMYNGSSQIANTSITCRSSTSSGLIDLLKTIEFNSTSNETDETETRIITTYLGDKLYYPETSHFYELDSTSETWNNASDVSSGLFGLHGYLATITSSGENDIAVIASSGANPVWIGASDAEGIVTEATEGKWYWVTGPEGAANSATGTLIGTTSGTSFILESGMYENWYNNYPDNSSNIQHYSTLYTNNDQTIGTGLWDDDSANATYNSIIEYGGMSNDTVTILDSFNLTYSKDTTGPTISGVTAGTIEIYLENASSYTPVTASYSDNVAVLSSSMVYLYSDGVTEFAGADDSAKLEAFRTHLSTSNTAILKYTATDVNNNTTTVLVTVHSSKAPVISTTKVEDLVVIDVPNIRTYELGDVQELLVTATHTYGFVEEDITDSMIIVGSVDFAHVGLYPVTYSASYGDVTTTVTVEYKIVDTVAPEIYVAPVKTVYLNSEYTLDEYIVTDNYDKEVTVLIKDTIRIGIPDVYTVTYTAIDSSGNQTSITQAVFVEQPDLLTKTVYVNGSSYLFHFNEGDFDFDTISLFVSYGVRVPFVDGNWTEGATTVQPDSNENVYLMMMDKDGNYQAKLIQGNFDGSIVEVYSDEPIDYTKNILVNDELITIELDETFDLSSTKLYINHGVKLPFFDDSWHVGYGIIQVPENEYLYLLYKDAAGHAKGKVLEVNGNISISKPMEVE